MAYLANVVPENVFSWRVLLSLLAVAVLSATTFALLVRRWTTQRRAVALSDWAKGKDFHVGNPEAPPALAGQFKSAPRVRQWLRSKDTLLVMFEIDDAGATTAPQSNSARTASQWHALMRELPIDAEWKPTGLRPAHARESLLDLYSLSSYP